MVHAGYRILRSRIQGVRAGERQQDVESASGTGAIAGYTVIHEGGNPPRGVAVVDVDGARAVVQTEDPALVARMESVELCGTSVRLTDGHSFTP